jgi:RNA polymerase sigma factor (TIGR02999 family)
MKVIPAQSVTQWLLKWREGDELALKELTELVYKDLHRLAKGYLRNERPDHTLQATALVHEAYLQLHELQHIDWKNRAQFISVVARVMRHVLVDHARVHSAAKRGGGAVKLSLSRADHIAADGEANLLELDQALERLALELPRKAQVVELFYFGGLGAEEIAEVLSVGTESISQRTVENDLKIARAWLRNMLKGDPA